MDGGYRAGPAAPRPNPAPVGRSVRLRACRSIEGGTGRRRAAGMQRTEPGNGESAPHNSSPVATPDVRAVLDALPQPAFVVGIGENEECEFVHANARYRTLFGLDRHGELRGDLRTVLPTDVLVAHITAFSRAQHEDRPVSFEICRESGRRWLNVEIVRLPDDWGDETCLLGVVHDVSEHKRIEALLAHRARHDPLTELPNRVMLLEDLGDALARARSRVTPPR